MIDKLLRFVEVVIVALGVKKVAGGSAWSSFR